MPQWGERRRTRTKKDGGPLYPPDRLVAVRNLREKRILEALLERRAAVGFVESSCIYLSEARTAREAKR